jgi:predicted RNA polymerase sigma factor
MSYDLMVFEKTKAPRTEVEFMEWYELQTSWNEEHDYQNSSITSLSLQNWYMDMKKTFPPMNGPDAPTDEQLENNEELEDYLTDYSIGKDIIYAAFAWSQAEAAYELALKLAKKHGVGFFDVSGEGEIE